MSYFDYAAATPMLPEVAKAMQPYFTDKFYNPSALYLCAQEVKHDLQEARSIVAQELGAKQTEIIFTAGGTEANNIAIFGVANQFEDAHIVTSAIEHESVLQPAKTFACTVVSVTSDGTVTPASIQDAITDKTVLVSIMLANNEIGTIQDVRTISRIITNIRLDRKARGIARPLYMHTDACQAVNYLDIHTSRLGIDLMTINAGKIYGPKQAGALFIKTSVQLMPLLFGGGQEKNIRSGTENVANYVGFATALKRIRGTTTQESKRTTELRDMMIRELVDDESIHLNGAKIQRRLANNIHISLDGLDNERVLMELDERGFQVATGSACSASNDEPSHVLKAIGLTDQQSRSSIRITLGRQTTHEQCKELIKSIKELVANSKH